MNVLAQEFRAKTLLAYAAPTILMMVFMSTYTIVDGLFVANFVGEDALSAVNIVMPVINLIFAIGLMFATGGTAVMGRLMGAGRDEQARAFLSVIYLVTTAIGLCLAVVCFIFPTQIVQFLGAEGDLLPYARDYLLSMAGCTVIFMLQVFVQTFFVLAGKPMLGFAVCFAGGLCNMLLDYLFISPEWLDLGIMGAGWATGIGNAIPAVFGVVYFACNRKGSLYFAKPVLHMHDLLQSMGNGMSELVGQLSTGVTTLLFNVILYRLIGKAGVAAISVILYIQMLQTAIYLGYSIGVAPIISYKYGAQDHAQLKKVLQISFAFLAVVSCMVIVASFVFDHAAVSIFISPTSETYALTKHGLHLFSIAYLFMGVNIMMSAMFTALSNGWVSAVLSCTRTLLFLVGCLYGLPLLLGIDGVWLAVPVAEMLAFFLSVYFFKRYRKVYHY